MRQSVAQVTAGCNKQNVVFNNRLLELQPAVMLQFCNITAGCYLNHWLLHTIFCLQSACWIKTNGMIYQVYPSLKQPRDLAPYFGALSWLRDLD